MAKLISEFQGVRGRSMKLYDTKCVIITDKTVGSFITGNFTDGEKTIFLCDVVGVQFKRSGSLIGYLQFETPSMQMNNKDSNMFSENTFTFEAGKNGITNEMMEGVYRYVTDRIEEIKYGTQILNKAPAAESGANSRNNYQAPPAPQTPPAPPAYSQNTYQAPQENQTTGNRAFSQYNQEPQQNQTPVVRDTGSTRKMNQCECGEMFHGIYCPVCGKRAKDQPPLQAQPQPQQQVQPQPQAQPQAPQPQMTQQSFVPQYSPEPSKEDLKNKSHVCKCGSRFYGEVCPYCGRDYIISDEQ